jgi:hypothetical protein
MHSPRPVAPSSPSLHRRESVSGTGSPTSIRKRSTIAHPRRLVTRVFVVLAVCGLAMTAAGVDAVAQSPGVPSPIAAQPFDGRWQGDPVTREDLVAAGFTPAEISHLDTSMGAPTMVFGLNLDGGRYSWTCNPPGGVIATCDQGSYEFGPDTWITTSTDGSPTYFRWALEDGALRITLDVDRMLAEHPGLTASDLADQREIFLKPFQRVEPASMPATADSLPDGVYQMAPIPVADIIAGLVADGFAEADATAWLAQNWPGASLVGFGVRFDSGRLSETEQTDLAPPAIGWQGRFAIQDTDTLVATGYGTVITYRYTLDGDQLSMHLLSDTDQDPGELMAQSAIYGSAPFTRQP